MDDEIQENPEGLEKTVTAVQTGDAETAKKWLSEGNTPDAIFQEGSLLFIAAQYGQKEIVDSLIVSKANLELAGNTKKTPLLEAAEKNRLDIVKSLIDAKANIKATSCQNSILTWVCNNQWESPALVSYLIEQKADVNCKHNGNGMTPLMHAIRYNHLDTMARLLQCAEVKLEQENNYHETALMVAIDRDCPLTIPPLLAARVDIDTITHNKKTAIMLAKKKKKENILDMLQTQKRQDVLQCLSILNEVVPAMLDVLWYIIIEYMFDYNLYQEKSIEARKIKHEAIPKKVVQSLNTFGAFKHQEPDVDVTGQTNPIKTRDSSFKMH